MFCFQCGSALQRYVDQQYRAIGVIDEKELSNLSDHHPLIMVVSIAIFVAMWMLIPGVSDFWESTLLAALGAACLGVGIVYLFEVVYGPAVLFVRDE